MLLSAQWLIKFECFSMWLSCLSQFTRPALIASFVVLNVYCSPAIRHDVARASTRLGYNPFVVLSLPRWLRSRKVICFWQAVWRFNFAVFQSKQKFIFTITHAKLSNLFEVILYRVWFCFPNFNWFARFARRHVLGPYNNVLPRFNRTHLSRSEVLARMQLSYCFASIHR